MQIGTVSELRRYPVKAMAGEALDAVEVGFHGLAGDRRYAFVQSTDTSGFPWLTIRQVPALTTYRAACPDGDPEAAPPLVTTPDGATVPVVDGALQAELEARHGGPVHLHRDDRGTQDAFPVSIMSRQTVAALGALAGRELEPHRFRPSIVIDVPGEADYPEDAFVGRVVALGDALRVRVDQRDSRCMVINFDPETAERDPRVLRAVAQQREQCLGVYGSVERPGLVRVGDPVVVEA